MIYYTPFFSECQELFSINLKLTVKKFTSIVFFFGVNEKLNVVITVFFKHQRFVIIHIHDNHCIGNWSACAFFPHYGITSHLSKVIRNVFFLLYSFERFKVYNRWYTIKLSNTIDSASKPKMSRIKGYLKTIYRSKSFIKDRTNIFERLSNVWKKFSNIFI